MAMLIAVFGYGYQSEPHRLDRLVNPDTCGERELRFENLLCLPERRQCFGDVNMPDHRSHDDCRTGKKKMRQ